MRYVQLRAFYSVARLGGFSRAAEAIGLTQPALSDQVRNLEQQYDLLLFNRRRKQVTLTDAGQRLFDILVPMFEQESRAREFLTESRALTEGAIRIIADSTCHVTDTIRRFQARYPAVRLTLTSGNSQDVLDALAAYRADIGVLGNHVPNGDMTALSLGTSPIIAFARKDFPGLSGPPPDLAQLAKFPLILREKGSKTRQKLEEAALGQHTPLVPAIEAEGREAVRDLVATGIGIGFVSEAEYGHDARLRKIPLSGPAILMEETVVCLKRRADVRVIRAFIGLVRATKASIAPDLPFSDFPLEMDP